MQTEKLFYRVYSLDTELRHYLNINGSPFEINGLNDNQSSEIMDFETNDEEEIDAQTKKDFLEDIELPENISVEELTKRIKRHQKIVNYLKTKNGHKCQLCGASFLMDNGNYYCEAHHIKMLSEGGSQSPENVIILCANHHREFHYANNAIVIGELLDDKREIFIGSEKYVVTIG